MSLDEMKSEILTKRTLHLLTSKATPQFFKLAWNEHVSSEKGEITNPDRITDEVD